MTKALSDVMGTCWFYTIGRWNRCQGQSHGASCKLFHSIQGYTLCKTCMHTWPHSKCVVQQKTDYNQQVLCFPYGQQINIWLFQCYLSVQNGEVLHCFILRERWNCFVHWLCSVVELLAQISCTESLMSDGDTIWTHSCCQGTDTLIVLSLLGQSKFECFVHQLQCRSTTKFDEISIGQGNFASFYIALNTCQRCHLSFFERFSLCNVYEAHCLKCRVWSVAMLPWNPVQCSLLDLAWTAAVHLLVLQPFSRLSLGSLFESRQGEGYPGVCIKWMHKEKYNAHF